MKSHYLIRSYSFMRTYWPRSKGSTSIFLWIKWRSYQTSFVGIKDRSRGTLHHRKSTRIPAPMTHTGLLPWLLSSRSHPRIVFIFPCIFSFACDFIIPLLSCIYLRVLMKSNLPFSFELLLNWKVNNFSLSSPCIVRQPWSHYRNVDTLFPISPDKQVDTLWTWT